VGSKAYPASSPGFGSQKIFLEVFSGCGRLSKAFARLGMPAEGLDIEHGPAGNLLHSEVFQRVEAAILNGVVAVMHLGMPCTTWSRARRWDGRGPCPLRDDDEFLWGYPMEELSKADAEKLQTGNRLTRRTLSLLRLACQMKIPVILENPMTSRCWKIPDLQAIIKQFRGTLCQADFCQYGTPWRKSTLFFAFFLPGLEKQLATCSGRGICSASKRPHTILSGVDSSGVFLTLKARPYPVQLYNTIARHVIQLLSSQSG